MNDKPEEAVPLWCPSLNRPCMKGACAIYVAEAGACSIWILGRDAIKGWTGPWNMAIDSLS